MHPSETHLICIACEITSAEHRDATNFLIFSSGKKFIKCALRITRDCLYIVFQWTFIRPCNGALSRRAECPLATYFINERPFWKPTAAIPVGSLTAVNAASAEFQKRKSKARYNPFSIPQKTKSRVLF